MYSNGLPSVVCYSIHVSMIIDAVNASFRASEKLVQVNQAFHDVLSKEESKKMYDQLCKFREVSLCMYICKWFTIM